MRKENSQTRWHPDNGRGILPTEGDLATGEGRWTLRGKAMRRIRMICWFEMSWRTRILRRIFCGITCIQKRLHGRFDDLAPAFMELFSKKETDEMMMTIAESLQMEGLEKGLVEGKAKGKIASVILVLESRFNAVPPALQEKLRDMRDDSSIDAMLKTAATCQTLEEFQKAL